MSRRVKIAAIDIGSNSVHMIIARDDGGMVYEIVDREKDMIKLGATAFKARHLSAEAIDTGVRSLKRFRRLTDQHGVEHVLAVATSAVREADNGEAFLAAVQAATGFSPRMITGQEEARLIHLAVTDVIDLSERRALIVDIGGGSVETILGSQREVLIGESLPLGVLRLRELIGADDPLPREARRRLEAIIRERAFSLLERARATGFELLVGTSGTILDLCEAVLRRRTRAARFGPDGRVVEREELRELAERLADMNARERARVPGIDGNRADTIHFGGLLLVGMMDLAKCDELVVSDVSIREGLILDHLQSAAGADALAAVEPDIRRRSAIALLRRCGQDGLHARHVAKLALQIFDQSAPVHRLGLTERRILECAGLLHDVGRHIDFPRHEQHSYYLIRQGQLRGFAEQEVEMVALTARYHRKGGPKPRHAEYGGLSPRRRRTVRVLAGILRIAEGLDRGHAQAVSSLACDATPSRLRLVVRAAQDVELEAWAAGRKASLLSSSLDIPVTIEVEPPRVQAS